MILWPQHVWHHSHPPCGPATELWYCRGGKACI